MKGPLISIILPVYNAQKYISKCIDSILSQTYINWELIVINDGSSDSTYDILTSYKDERIKINNITNHGVSYSRNYALSISSGTYIMFIDADDWLSSNCLYEMYNSIIKYDSDLIVVAHNEINSETMEIKKNNKFSASVSLYGDEIIRSFFMTDMFGWEVWGKLYKREIISNIRFPEDRKIAEDVSFLFNTLKRCKKVTFVKLYLYNYLINPYSIMQQKFSYNNLGTIISVDEIYDSSDKLIYAKCFKIKYYIWILRRYVLCGDFSDKELSFEMTKVITYIKNNKFTTVKDYLSRKYLVEGILIKYSYNFYKMILRFLFGRKN